MPDVLNAINVEDYLGAGRFTLAAPHAGEMATGQQQLAGSNAGSCGRRGDDVVGAGRHDAARHGQ
ncbi:MAG: hypothetical protein ACE369_14395 [Roseovarius sp.]